MTMSRTLSPLSLVRGLMFGVFVFWGCETSDLGTVDSAGLPPYADAAAVRPDTVKLRTLTPTNGVYAITALAQVRVAATEQGKDVTGATVTIYAPGSANEVTTATLRDDGVSPDTTAGDLRFTGTVRFSATITQAGAYRARFVLTGAAGLESNLLERVLFVDRDNNAPVIASIIAPDTVDLSSDTLKIGMAARAIDADGPTDVKEVYFRSLDSSDPNNKFYLLDNGDVRNGDAVKGDSLYSIIIVLPPNPALKKTYRFAFQAADTYGDTSATVIHRLTVR